MANYVAEHFDEIDVVSCPCGYAQRAFAGGDNDTATVHVVEITADSKVHYHKAHTEIYTILDGQGHIELDGHSVHVKPMSTVMIKPGCRHRAVGRLRLLNVCIPPFDPADEYFD